ncbi:hypothetical protein PInf_006020 [Phytophthora infestans]|nr:hypothetical protein PInf_006020 [Phytophthora infestans]
MLTTHASSPSAPNTTETRRAGGPDSLQQELRLPVSGGDYGNPTYLIHDMYKHLHGSRDRYIGGGFSWSFAVKGEAAVLVFRNACDDVSGFRGQAKFPKDDTHLRSMFNIFCVLEFIKAGIQEEWKAQRECPPDQLVVQLPGYYSKLKFPTDQPYMFPLSTGSKRPPFKWGNNVNSFNRMLKASGSAVVVQRPGDVVYLNSWVYHSVLLGFLPQTPPSKR